MGYCHCQSCRSWSGGPLNAFTLWKPDAVKVTKGADQIAMFSKTPMSERQYCKTCGGHIMAGHPPLGVVDVFYATIPTLDFKPGVHLNYQESVLPIKDGLPKLKDFPERVRRLGRDDSGVAPSVGGALSNSEAIHPAQVAGMFYPAEPDALNALITDVRKRARPDGGVAPKVVIAPHAGLVYSGSVAATAFGAWARRAEPPRRIVIIGPAHRVAFSGVAVHPASKWRTPLGEAPVAPVAHAELAQAPGVVVDPRPFVGEHSLEMHLVMLQAMLPAPFEIVPILVGDADPLCVAEALRRVWGGPETVVAVSSDLSHFLDRGRAESIDSDTAGASRRSTPPRSMAAGLAASWPSRRRSRSPPSATCGEPACIWRHRPTWGRTLRGSSATAPLRSNTQPRRDLPRLIASVCFRPA